MGTACGATLQAGGRHTCVLPALVSSACSVPVKHHMLGTDVDNIQGRVQSLEESTDDQAAPEVVTPAPQSGDEQGGARGTAVRALTTAAGVAAAGIGGAAIAGGMAVDLTDVAMVASLYGVATALRSSRSAEVREKGAAGPLFSVLYTAADIAKKVKYGVGGGRGAPPRKLTDEERAALLGRYEQSTMADQSRCALLQAIPEQRMAEPPELCRFASIVLRLRVCRMRTSCLCCLLPHQALETQTASLLS